MIYQGLNEECGVFGVFAPKEDAARMAYFALFSLQHRGQESAGIASSDGEKLHILKGMGLVSQVFDEPALETLLGDIAIGHNRYSTTGTSSEENVSPIIKDSDLGPFALAHNGNLINSEGLKRDLDASFEFTTTTDSEIMACLIASSKKSTFEEKILDVVGKLKGAYSVTLLTKDALYAFRDPNGFRPLSLARCNKGYAVASETCAFGTVGAHRLRDIGPGEVVKITKNSIKSYKYPSTQKSFCIFEYIYFSRPDTIINKQSVYSVRENLGKALAKEHPARADMVIGVPDSGIPAAIGYSIESEVPYREGFIKNKYIGRTFIDPDQRLRERGVKLKLNALRSVITGKKIIMVDDSIVRGNTTKNIVGLLKEKGAKEVHVRITCPPIKHPCFFGVDMPTYEELIANNMKIPEIQQFAGADSLGYLSLEGLIEATGLKKDNFCLACFNGEYPLKIDGQKGKLALKEKEPTLIS